MTTAILLCSDLDRTLLPNGVAPESAEARPRLRRLAARPELTLAYVSGRHHSLLRQAIADYVIPPPDFAIGDVGTTLYEIHGDEWRPWREWAEHIAPDWAGAGHDDLAALFADLDLLRLQEPEKQNTFKLSYYTPSGLAHDELLAEMQSRLAAKDVRASLVWSVDEAADVGLLDVLPASATKLHAVEFLMARRGFDPTRTVFAGDSGNDLPVVTSGRLQSVLVRNAHPEVVSEASRALRAQGLQERLYVARGGFHQMNGNYSAGVLEGVAHFLPETEAWM
ncbi:hypothetical protein SAMN03097708_02581 [Thiohalomonas denitrificans]|uniref:Sucrose phosphatase-like domain-containing protein n=1 Tax=Thiohalomonas denitrificans TaxID=415747 RepID=A0A1G5QR05_9GAMM|nr:hypothetical protein SAMN03097708_02581 [Thiohalomonas denitrificans]